MAQHHFPSCNLLVHMRQMVVEDTNRCLGNTPYTFDVCLISFSAIWRLSDAGENIGENIPPYPQAQFNRFFLFSGQPHRAEQRRIDSSIDRQTVGAFIFA